MTAVKKINLSHLFHALDENHQGKVEVCDLFEPEANEKTIRISKEESTESVLKVAKSFDNFYSVQENSLNPEKAIQLAALMVTDRERFFSDPVQSILNPRKDTSINITTIYNRDYNSLTEKYQVLEEIEKALNQFVNSSSLVYDVESISDEFITNSIFHANDIQNRKDHMETGEWGNLKLCLTDSELLIICQDPHGKLIPSYLFSRIYTCATSDIAGTINMGQGGAGIGSFLVHSMSSSYIIAVKENVQTIISSVLPLKMSNRKRVQLPKNVYSLYVKEKKNG